MREFGAIDHGRTPGGRIHIQEDLPLVVWVLFFEPHRLENALLIDDGGAPHVVYTERVTAEERDYYRVTTVRVSDGERLKRSEIGDTEGEFRTYWRVYGRKAWFVERGQLSRIESAWLLAPTPLVFQSPKSRPSVFRHLRHARPPGSKVYGDSPEDGINDFRWLARPRSGSSPQKKS